MFSKFFSRIVFLILIVFSFGGVHAFEYKYKNNVLIVNDRGAWVRSGKKSVALISQFNAGLLEGGMRGRYEFMRKQAILVSLVGPYASFRVLQYRRPVDSEKSAVARSIGYVYVHVVDIRQPNKPATPVSLLDIFSEQEIRHALENSTDQILRQAYERFDKNYDLNSFNLEGLPPDGDFLYEFVFGDVDHDVVDVNLQIHTPGFGDGLDRDVFYRLRLPVPRGLNACFAKAKLKEKGFLSDNFEKKRAPEFLFPIMTIPTKTSRDRPPEYRPKVVPLAS